MYTRCPRNERDKRTNKLCARQEQHTEGVRFGLTTCRDVLLNVVEGRKNKRMYDTLCQATFEDM